MSKDKLLITGASGLLGTAICKDLTKDYTVVGCDVAKPNQPVDGVTYLDMNITDDESISSALETVRREYGDRFAAVIHLAAYYDFSGEPSRMYDEVSVKGTQNLLKHLKDFTVERFIFSSTMLVHSPAEPPAHIAEDDPLDAKWDYPKSKVAAEEVIQQSHEDIPIVVLRIAGVYSDRCDSLPLAHQICRIAEDRITSHVFPGNTSHGQSFVHIDDVVSAVRRIIERRHELPEEETFLIGEPVTYSYDEIQRTLGKIIHGDEDWITRQIPKAIAKTGAAVRDAASEAGTFIKPWMVDFADDHYELDVSRAQEELGWSPKHRLIDSLPEMVGALRNAPSKWYAEHGLGDAPDEVGNE
jgi:nucleoside-diphosphate-sugar epimerase